MPTRIVVKRDPTETFQHVGGALGPLGDPTGRWLTVVTQGKRH